MKAYIPACIPPGPEASRGRWSRAKGTAARASVPGERDPAVGPSIVGENACDDVFGWAERDPGRVTFGRQSEGRWLPVTASQFAAWVATVAAGLIAEGIQPGDRVALMAATGLDWVVCDFAIWAAGAVTVPVYETSSVEQIRWILGDSGAVAELAGNARHAEAIKLAPGADGRG